MLEAVLLAAGAGVVVAFLGTVAGWVGARALWRAVNRIGSEGGAAPEPPPTGSPGAEPPCPPPPRWTAPRLPCHTRRVPARRTTPRAAPAPGVSFLVPLLLLVALIAVRVASGTGATLSFALPGEPSGALEGASAGRLAGRLAGRHAVSGERRAWHTLTVDFEGPPAHELDSAPNPFLDYRLQVTFPGPAGQLYDVPGFFDGDGAGGGAGRVWRVRFSPDAPGTWLPGLLPQRARGGGCSRPRRRGPGGLRPRRGLVRGRPARPRGPRLPQVGPAGVRRGALPQVPGRSLLDQGRHRQPGEPPGLQRIPQHPGGAPLVRSPRRGLAARRPGA